MENLIICRADISSGSPTIIGRRLTVYNVVSALYQEKDIDYLIEEFELSFEEIKQSHSYCSNLHCITDPRRTNFCANCILRTLVEKDIIEVEELLNENGINIISEKFKDQDIFRKGWNMAQDNAILLRFE